MPVVTLNALDITGVAPSNVTSVQVRISIVSTDGSTPAFANGGGVYSFDKTYHPAASTGLVSATLVANELLTPANTVYRVKVIPAGREKAKTFTISVPNGAGPYTVEDLLVDVGEIASPALSTHIATVSHHTDWSDTAPTSGQVPIWNGSAYVPGDTVATDLEAAALVTAHEALTSEDDDVHGSKTYTDQEITTLTGLTLLRSRNAINLKDAGALGDGTTDDTAAIQNAISDLPANGGALIAPAGAYPFDTSITDTKPVKIVGEGAGYRKGPSHFSGPMTSFLWQGAEDEPAFKFEGGGHVLEDFALIYDGASTPIAGSIGIHLNDDTATGGGFQMRGVSTQGFWNNVQVNNLAEWIYQNCYVFAPLNYGLYINNFDRPDGGDMRVISNQFIADPLVDGAAALRWEAGGGVVAMANKVNQGAGATTGRFTRGFDFSIGNDGNTVDCIVIANSLENIEEAMLYFGRQVGSTKTLSDIHIIGNQTFNNNSGSDIFVGEGMQRVVIDANIVRSGDIQIDGATDVLVTPNNHANDISISASSTLKQGIGAQKEALTLMAATDVVRALKVRGDSVNRYAVQASGRQEWGSGSATRDIGLARVAADVLGLDDGDSFDVQGLYNGGTLRLADYRLWVDSTGTVRAKSSAPASETDGIVVGSVASDQGSALIERIALGADGAELLFDAIPQTYRHLRIVLACRTVEAVDSSELQIRFNADSGTNYAAQRVTAAGATTSSSNVVSQTGIGNYFAPGSNPAAGHVANYVIDIPDYRGAFNKGAIIEGGFTRGTVSGTLPMYSVRGWWFNTAAITEVRIAQAGGSNLLAGSTASLYGMR